VDNDEVVDGVVIVVCLPLLLVVVAIGDAVGQGQVQFGHTTCMIVVVF
jgi:hypothetical protein